MTSQLMPAYYTTTKTSRKTKKRKKTASLLKVEADHEKFLKKVLGGSGRANASTLTDGARSSQANRAGGSIPLTSIHDHRSVAQPGSASGLGPEGRKFKSCHSDQFYNPSMAKKEEKKYTGTEIIGIATMHKSNAVPVRGKKQAEEISRMRRG
jgi:hypothetical protein